jgi:hypothetical protein
MPPLRRVLVRLQPLLVLLAFGLMSLLVIRQWHSVLAYHWELQFGWLVLSGLALWAGWFVEIRMWQSALGLLGGRLDFSTATHIWFSSAIVRYIPGNIWQPLSMAVRCETQQIAPEVTLASVLLFHIVHMLAVAAMAALSLGAWGHLGARFPIPGSPSVWWAAGLAAPVVLVLGWPHTLLALGNRALTRFGRTPLPSHLSSGGLARLLGICAVSWIFASVGFAAFVYALTRPAGQPFWLLAPYLAAAYSVAYACGFLSLLTPSGLGVREGVLYLLLVPVLGSGGAVGLALAMRVWEVALEMVVSATVVGLPHILHANTGRSQ